MLLAENLILLHCTKEGEPFFEEEMWSGKNILNDGV